MTLHLTDKTATIFGSSSEAIIALEVLIHSLKRVQTMVVHEPPAVNLLTDAAKWLTFFDGIYDSFRENEVPKAMHQFAAGHLEA